MRKGARLYVELFGTKTQTKSPWAEVVTKASKGAKRRVGWGEACIEQIE